MREGEGKRGERETTRVTKHTQRYVHSRTHAHTHTHTHTCTHVHIYTHRHACTYTHMRYTCTPHTHTTSAHTPQVHTHTHTYIYTYTHLHRHSLSLDRDGLAGQSVDLKVHRLLIVTQLGGFKGQLRPTGIFGTEDARFKVHRQVRMISEETFDAV